MNYRRFIFAGLAAVLTCSFAAAQEAGGLGLTPKLEIGFGDVADKAVISISPGVEYENTFIGSLDVFGELDYIATLADPDMTHDVYEEVELGYNLSFGEASVLSIILNNNNEFRLSPALSEYETFTGTLEPSVLFTQGLGFGDLYGQLGFPINYLTGIKDADIGIGTYLTLGWASTFGLGVELTGNLALSPDSGYNETGLLLSYETGIVYGEVEISADKEFKFFTIAPKVDVFFAAWTFYVKAGILIPDGGDISFSPALGVKYSL